MVESSKHSGASNKQAQEGPAHRSGTRVPPRVAPDGVPAIWLPSRLGSRGSEERTFSPGTMKCSPALMNHSAEKVLADALASGGLFLQVRCYVDT
jgi:hypothetical protein